MWLMDGVVSAMGGAAAKLPRPMQKKAQWDKFSQTLEALVRVII